MIFSPLPLSFCPVIYLLGSFGLRPVKVLTGNSALLCNKFVFQPKDRAKMKKEANPGFERANSVTSDASTEVYKL